MAEDSKTQHDKAGGKRLRNVLIGWVLVPALVMGALFAAGVHVGARHPDMLLTRGVLWLGAGEAERPPQAESEPAGAEPEGLPSAASQPPELIQLKFGWPAPAQAIVEQTIEEPGNNAKLRYRIEVERQGEKLLVHHRDARVLELKGQPVDGDSNGAEVEGQLLLAGFIPSIVVAADGEFERIIDMDAYIERTREALAASPEQHDEIAAIMSSPKMQWALEQKIGDIWRGWAELWLELELMSDQGLRVESHAGISEYRVLGFDAQTVSLEFRLDHELTNSELHDMFEAAGLAAELEGATGGKDVVVTATLRRDTMLPLSSSTQMDIWVELPGESRRTQRELTRYTFEWQ
jgi:hypothetical protein